jgi:uncharacterized membrane protein YphA (DoxX/SURF4 family)
MDTAVNYGAHTTAHAHEESNVDRVISLLRWTYGLVPIAAGADKFAHILTDWDKYLAPAISNMLPFAPHTFMSIVGIIEIVAGIIVLVKPRIGSLVVGLWLIGIAINLLISGQYFDIAVRDTVMAIGAFSLCLLLSGREQHGHKRETYRQK